MSSKRQRKSRLQRGPVPPGHAAAPSAAQREADALNDRLEALSLRLLARHAENLERRAEEQGEAFALSFTDLRALKQMRELARSRAERLRDAAEPEQPAAPAARPQAAPGAAARRLAASGHAPTGLAAAPPASAALVAVP